MAFFNQQPDILGAISRAKSELCNAEAAMKTKDEKAAFWHINKAQEELKQSSASLMGNVESEWKKTILQGIADRINGLLTRAENGLAELEKEQKEQKEKQGEHNGMRE